MSSDKLMHLARERIGAQSQVIRIKAVFLAQLIAALTRRKIGRAEGNQTDLSFASLHNLRPWDEGTCGLKLLRQPFHVVEVVVRPLGVLGFLIMATTAREVGRESMICASQGTIANSIAIHVLIASESAKPR